MHKQYSLSTVRVLPVGTDIHRCMVQRTYTYHPGGDRPLLSAQGLRTEQGTGGSVRRARAAAGQPGSRQVSVIPTVVDFSSRRRRSRVVTGHFYLLDR